MLKLCDFPNLEKSWKWDKSLKFQEHFYWQIIYLFTFLNIFVSKQSLIIKWFEKFLSINYEWLEKYWNFIDALNFIMNYLNNYFKQYLNVYIFCYYHYYYYFLIKCSTFFIFFIFYKFLFNHIFYLFIDD